VGPCLDLADSCEQYEKQESENPSGSTVERRRVEVAQASHHGMPRKVREAHLFH
jgi:hypothetical protein